MAPDKAEAASSSSSSGAFLQIERALERLTSDPQQLLEAVVALLSGGALAPDGMMHLFDGNSWETRELNKDLCCLPTKATKDLRYLWPRLPAPPLISRRDNQAALSSGYEHRSRATANRPAGHMD